MPNLRACLFFSLVFGFAACQFEIPTAEESIEELVDAGVSETAAVGIVKFDAKFQEPFELEKSDPEAAKKAIEQLHTEFNDYIESLSDEDQAAYQQFIKKKHSQ
ncbi:unnamed protein product [Caenorhabditis sp. 36 PRJEB53466]|nr:unnamed protein product [Caenorhabditis sp. 36 PRJEB53466]